MKSFPRWVMVAALVLGASCSLPTNETLTSSVQSGMRMPDSKGNLLVVNQSSRDLVLKVDGTVSKAIPSETSGFLVEVTGKDTSVSLTLWDHDTLFRRWDVVLGAASGRSEDWTVWTVGEGAASNAASATVVFSYPAAGIDGTASVYSVDVFLSSREGAKLLSLKPGIAVKKLGLAYGTYSFLYRYWKSDGGSTEGQTEVGWLGPEEGRSFNANAPKATVAVPVYYDAQRWAAGKVTIVNTLSRPTKVFLLDNGDQAIESVAILPPGTDPTNLSVLNAQGAAGSQAAFWLPSGRHRLVARAAPDFSQAIPGSEVTVDVGGGGGLGHSWTLYDGVSKTSILTEDAAPAPATKNLSLQFVLVTDTASVQSSALLVEAWGSDSTWHLVSQIQGTTSATGANFRYDFDSVQQPWLFHPGFRVRFRTSSEPYQPDWYFLDDVNLSGTSLLWSDGFDSFMEGPNTWTSGLYDDPWWVFNRDRGSAMVGLSCFEQAQITSRVVDTSGNE